MNNMTYQILAMEPNPSTPALWEIFLDEDVLFYWSILS